MVAAGGSDSDGTPFTAARAQLHLRRDPKADALDLMVSADDIKAQGNIARLFGDHIKSLTHLRQPEPGRMPSRRLLAGDANPGADGGGKTGGPKAARWRSGRWRLALAPALNLHRSDRFADARRSICARIS